jgi:hypothetical protein
MPAQNINSLLANVPKLTRSNYHEWKFAIIMVLRRSGCWEITKGTVSRPATRDAAEKWDIKSEEGLTSIGLTIDSDQYQYIEDATTGPEAWEALSKVYEKNSRGNRIALKRQFYGYVHDTNKSIQIYISGILGLATRLKAIKVKLEDTDIMDVLLFNLDSDWSNIAATLCATTDELNVVADITGALLDEEGRRGGPPVDHGSESALRASHEVTCINCKKQGHRKADCWAKGGDKEGHIKCFKCQKEGHLAYQCPDQISDTRNNANFGVEF